MATKYTRENNHTQDNGVRVMLRQGSGRGRINKKGRFMAISLGLCACIFALSFYDMMHRRDAEFENQPVIDGPGLIFEKTTSTTTSGAPFYMVGVRVLRPDGTETRLQGFARVDEASFDDTSQGDRVEIRYQMNRDGDAILVHSLTRSVPLPKAGKPARKTPSPSPQAPPDLRGKLYARLAQPFNPGGLLRS